MSERIDRGSRVRNEGPPPQQPAVPQVVHITRQEDSELECAWDEITCGGVCFGFDDQDGGFLIAFGEVHDLDRRAIEDLRSLTPILNHPYVQQALDLLCHEVPPPVTLALVKPALAADKEDQVVDEEVSVLCSGMARMGLHEQQQRVLLGYVADIAHTMELRGWQWGRTDLLAELEHRLEKKRRRVQAQRNEL